MAYRRDRAAGRARYVDAEPTRARLAELAAAKVPLRTLARACGLSDTGIKAILAGTREHVQRSSAERVEQLSLHRIYAEQTSGKVPRIGAARRVHRELRSLTDVVLGQAGVGGMRSTTVAGRAYAMGQG